MDRQIITQRITAILDDVSRLQSALYAMSTTDIQRYPDNYEVLSTDAALRGEAIACRLRHFDLCHHRHEKGGISAVGWRNSGHTNSL